MDKEYCITTIVVGDKYRDMFDVFMSTYNNTDKPMPRVLVYTDDVDKTTKWNNTQLRKIENTPLRVNNDFNMSLKRLAFQHAIDEGYEKMIFIDIDRTIEDWNPRTIVETTKHGFGTNWLQYMKHQKHSKSDKKHDKYEAIFSGFGDDTLYNNAYPIFGESLNIVHETTEVIQKFIDIWSDCSDFIQQSECTPRHINVEMGIALKLASINIYKYTPPIDIDFKGSIFRHYCYGKKGQMLKLKN